MAPELEGFLNILKPPGMTSHDVVSYLRRVLSLRRIGHTGTLDPQAAGVLPICLGRATRLSALVMDQCKGYRAELTLGWNTDTQDAWGVGEATLSPEMVQQIAPEARIRETLSGFIGTIRQQPPMVSAVRHQGRKLYEWARDGVEVERPTREVVIHSLEILAMDVNPQGYPRVLLEVVCSKGTYIRTLCADVGRQLGVGGHLSYLLRTRSGPFIIRDANPLEEVVATFAQGALKQWLMPLDYVLQQLPAHYLNADGTRRFQLGQPLLANDDSWMDGEMLRVYGAENDFVGLGQLQMGQIWPRKVFHKE
jgi:tRNA pseudouridine55 synthase